MQGNRSTGTKPELLLRKALWSAGLKGYQVNVRRLPGTPDVVFTKPRIAILVHGCFWHGCPHCSNYRLPKTNTDFWKQKLEENRARDGRTASALTEIGFKVLIVWECQLEREICSVIDFVRKMIASVGQDGQNGQRDLGNETDTI
jgi:DNA mismatch endonuclease (patch repair protein)